MSSVKFSLTVLVICALIASIESYRGPFVCFQPKFTCNYGTLAIPPGNGPCSNPTRYCNSGTPKIRMSVKEFEEIIEEY
uniref:Uncharacterized protein n=1 Tax=Ciona intestinalis TaxID=7719 RepID=H2XM53_CIOIN